MDALSRRADEHAWQADRIRLLISAWLSRQLATPDVLAWSFAAGAWWASAEPGPARCRSPVHEFIRLINLAWMAWPLILRFRPDSE